jgi:hypothetical protein
MDYVLVTFNLDHGREFVVKSMWITTKEEFKTLISKLDDISPDVREVEVYFGANEYFYIEDVNEFIESIIATPILESTYLELRKIIGENFGFMPIPNIIELFIYYAN